MLGSGTPTTLTVPGARTAGIVPPKNASSGESKCPVPLAKPATGAEGGPSPAGVPANGIGTPEKTPPKETQRNKRSIISKRSP